jgi:hypothetical protein
LLRQSIPLLSFLGQPRSCFGIGRTGLVLIATAAMHADGDEEFIVQFLSATVCKAGKFLSKRGGRPLQVAQPPLHLFIMYDYDCSGSYYDYSDNTNALSF